MNVNYPYIKLYSSYYLYIGDSGKPLSRSNPISKLFNGFLREARAMGYCDNDVMLDMAIMRNADQNSEAQIYNYTKHAYPQFKLLNSKHPSPMIRNWSLETKVFVDDFLKKMLT